MYRLSCDISISGLKFDFITDVMIKSSWKDLSDVATIRLPRNLKWRGEELKNLIKRGDKVSIELGYDFENRSEFVGYVSAVNGSVPVEIRCEDEMWKLKQTEVTKSWRAVTLSELLSEILPLGTEFSAEDISLAKLRFSKVSVYKVLEFLRQKFGIVSFFRDGKLTSGFAYNQENSSSVINFQKNVISSDLEYRRDDDISIKVRAISIQKNGKKIEVEIGEGEIHTLHFYDLDEKTLRNVAEKEAERLTISGYNGRVELFGQPFIQHGDGVTIKDSDYPEREGKYLVDSVQVKFGQNGFRRTVKVGKRI